MAAPSAVKFHVYRYDPEVDPEPYFREYMVVPRPGMTVLDGLFEILDKQDGSLAMRFACREAVCGSCSMFINGQFRLACQTQILSLGGVEPECPPGGASLGSNVTDIWVSPLPRMRVIKDLVVDLEPFFENLARIKPYLITKSLPPKTERLQSPEERQLIEDATNCILCACCHGSCPPAWLSKDYLGPATLLKAQRFAWDSRDEGQKEHLKATDKEYGVWRCHTVFNCTEACPKCIKVTDAIQQLKRRNALLRLKFWER